MQQDENKISLVKKYTGKKDVPLLLVAGVMLLSVAIKLIFKFWEIKNINAFVVLCVVQLLLYIMPVAVYFMLEKDCTKEDLKIKKFSFSCVPIIISGALLLFFSVLVLKYTSVYFLNLQDNSIQTYFYTGSNVYVIIAGVFVPMICEEILLRGLFLSQLQKYTGIFSAIIISSLAFAMLHFSSANFFVYFGAGLILGSVTYISGSVVPAIVLHGINNLTALFTESAVISYANENVGGMFAYVFLLALFLASLLLFIYMQEKFYLKKAFEQQNESKIQTEQTQKVPLWKMLCSPVFAVCVIIFAASVIFHL